MKVIYDTGKIKKVLRKAVLIIGVFDGIHRGHQQLIRTAVRKARRWNAKTILLTFYPHPVQVLHPEIYLPYISSLKYRLKLIEELGVDVCIVQSFTKSFSRMTPASFIKDYLFTFIQPQVIFVGDDFRFGKDRSGSLEDFQALGGTFGFQVHAVKALKGGRRKIGSTIIRREIAQGNLKKAAAALGRPVSIFGQVVTGDRRGKTLGYPTANIFPDGEVLPPLGVYAVHVVIEGKKYGGMANLGRRPSFGGSMNPVNIEVHLFDFHRNIYGRNILIQFLKKIRNEKAFSSKEQLIAQLKRDELNVKKILK